MNLLEKGALMAVFAVSAAFGPGAAAQTNNTMNGPGNGQPQTEQTAPKSKFTVGQVAGGLQTVLQVNNEVQGVRRALGGKAPSKDEVKVTRTAQSVGRILNILK